MKELVVLYIVTDRADQIYSTWVMMPGVAYV
jgi:hypothetical protein